MTLTLTKFLTTGLRTPLDQLMRIKVFCVNASFMFKPVVHAQYFFYLFIYFLFFFIFIFLH